MRLPAVFSKQMLSGKRMETILDRTTKNSQVTGGSFYNNDAERQKRDKIPGDPHG